MRLFLICFIIPWMGWLTIHLPEPAGYLQVEVAGLKNHIGQVLIAIVTEDQYQDDQAVGFGGRIPVSQSNQIVFLSTGIQPGAYAVKVFHDVNSNGQLDFNLLGIPREPYGFSNNARGRFGPPDFKDAAVQIPENDTLRIRIDL